MAVYCVQFGEANDYWLSSPGTFYLMGTYSQSCDKRWVTIETGEFNALVAASAAPPVTGQFTSAEVAILKSQAANPSPFNLSISDGALVSGAIVGTWAVAWAARQFVRALGSDGEE